MRELRQELQSFLRSDLALASLQLKLGLNLPLGASWREITIDTTGGVGLETPYIQVRRCVDMNVCGMFCIATRGYQFIQTHHRDVLTLIESL